MASLAWSFLMLVLVLAAVPASLWAMKRLQTLRPAGSAPRAMAVVASLPLGPRERLVTVKVGQRTLVLGVTAQQVALVAELQPGETL